MTGRLLLYLLLCVSAGGMGTQARACGNKFLSHGRSSCTTRVYEAGSPSRIVVVRGSNPNGREVLGGIVADFLKRSGHEVSLLSPSDIRSSTEVLIALQPALILALEPELGAIRAQLQDTDLHADLLPVLYKPGSEELASVRADYGLALAVPNRLSQLLAIVDQALDKSTRVAS